MALGVGGATAEGGQGFFFVGEGGDGLDQAREFKDFADVAGGIQELEAAALALESYERADQSADAGAVHLCDAGEIDEDVRGASFCELPQFRAEFVVAGADNNAALQVDDSYISGFPQGNLQAHDNLLCNPRCASSD